jgi:nucleotide-binding universal stress UspA family protein
VGDNTPSLVQNYCKAVDADMVAAMASQRGNMALLTGTFAHSMVSGSDIPVLNITAKEKHVPAGFATRGYR